MNTSYTMTKGELIDEVIEHVKPILEVGIHDYIMGDVDANYFDRWHNLKRLESETSKSKEIEDMIEYWCEMLSEDWFENHPEVEDVLLLMNTTTDGYAIKEWICSRSQIIVNKS